MTVSIRFFMPRRGPVAPVYARTQGRPPVQIRRICRSSARVAISATPNVPANLEDSHP